MKSIVIASNSSGGGKTTVTLGLMRAIINRGYSVQGYKVGPDYIDPAFHSRITGRASRNLDMFLMGETGVKASYHRGNSDYGVVEGVMGLYDGRGITSEYSTAHVARTLGLPIILVLSPKSQCATLCAEINGMINFEKTNIAGVILNNISESYYKLLKAAIEKSCPIEVFGYIPKEEGLSLKSRHLGLVQSSEVEDLENKVQLCSELIERHVELDRLLGAFREIVKCTDEFHLGKRNLKIAVALDKAFSFYYKENLELLEELGEVTYFSPLKDEKLPEGINFLYIGGGYPEVFTDELSSNVLMLRSIKEALKGSLRCYAECGGLMYLSESIEGKSTVGFLKGKAYMSSRLQNFGYAEISVGKDNNLLQKGLNINCHEFHKSFVELEEDKVYSLRKEMYDGTVKSWNCGYVKNNTLAAYPHVHFYGNMEFLKQIVRR